MECFLNRLGDRASGDRELAGTEIQISESVCDQFAAMMGFQCVKDEDTVSERARRCYVGKI